MAGLVVCDALPFLVLDVHPLACQPREHAVERFLKVLELDALLVPPGGEERGLVAQVLEVRPHEPRRAAGEDGEIHVRGELLVPDMDLEDRLPPVQIRGGNCDLAVESPGAEQGEVEDIGAVRGGEDDHPGVPLEPVHLREELVQRLFPLVVPTPQARAPLAAHGIDLVDEHDARGARLRFLEHVPHPGCPHPDEHLHEVRPGDGEKRDAGLAGDRAGEEGLPRARRPHEEDPFGDLRPEAHEPPRIP